MDYVLLVVVIVVALGFDFTNGFHDTANAVATSVSTVHHAEHRRSDRLRGESRRSIRHHRGRDDRRTGIVASDLITTKTLLAALPGAIVWNLLTWWFGLPSSSSHALIGGLVGAALAQSGEEGVQWHGLAHKVAIPAVIAPPLAFAGAFLLLIGIFWVFRRITRGHRQPRFSAGSARVEHVHGIHARSERRAEDNGRDRSGAVCERNLKEFDPDAAALSARYLAQFPHGSFRGLAERILAAPH